MSAQALFSQYWSGQMNVLSGRYWTKVDVGSEPESLARAARDVLRDTLARSPEAFSSDHDIQAFLEMHARF